MKRKLQLGRETLVHLQGIADLRRLAEAGAGIRSVTTTNPSVIDGCPSTPSGCFETTTQIARR